jgi:hypothetical protein
MNNLDPENPIPYETDDDIVSYLEKRFGDGLDDYFVLTQQTLKNPKTKNSFVVVHLQDKNNKYHTIPFKRS